MLLKYAQVTAWSIESKRLWVPERSGSSKYCREQVAISATGGSNGIADQRSDSHHLRRAFPAAALGSARTPWDDRDQVRLRHGAVRRMHRVDRRSGAALLRADRRAGGRKENHHDRG